MGLTLFMLITLIILLILSQSVSVRIYGSSELHISLSLTVFAFELAQNNEKRGKAQSFHFPEILRVLIAELLPSTDVRVRSANFAAARIFPNPASMIGGAILLPMVLAYVKRKSGTFSTDGNSDEAVDILFFFPLTALLISFMKALRQVITKRIGRRVNA